MELLKIEEVIGDAAKRRSVTLNLSHLDLTVVPSSLNNLAPFLRQLYLNDNKLILPPAEVTTMRCFSGTSVRPQLFDNAAFWP